MLAIILLLCSLAALNVCHWLSILLVDATATSLAAYYRWRSTRVIRELLAGRPSADVSIDVAYGIPTRRHRRLMARLLRLSLAMTEHYSLFPRSSERGYAIAEALGKGLVRAV